MCVASHPTLTVGPLHDLLCRALNIPSAVVRFHALRALVLLGLPVPVSRTPAALFANSNAPFLEAVSMVPTEDGGGEWGRVKAASLEKVVCPPVKSTGEMLTNIKPRLYALMFALSLS